MKIEVKELPRYGRELICEVDAERVSSERQRITEDLRHSVQLPGFRKGRVPLDMIEKRFDEDIREKLINTLVSETFFAGAKEHNLSTVIEPEVSEVKLETTLSFKVYIEVAPEVQVSGYQGIVVRKIEPEKVTEEKVDEILNQWEQRKEFAAAIIDPEKRRAWREKIREQLASGNIRKAREAEDEQVWQHLLKGVDFEVPEKLMLRRARKMAEEQLSYSNLQNMAREDIQKLAEDIFEKAKPVAEMQLKRFFILAKIAEIENIVTTDEEVEQHLQHLSKISGESLEEIRKKVTDNEKIDDIREDIRLDKTFAFIKSKAEIIAKVVLPGEKI
ncbi:MAG: trigger factor [Candidatus Ratteibacteria bacterium]